MININAYMAQPVASRGYCDDDTIKLDLFLVKTTRYFDFIRTRPDRRIIQDSWIKRVIQSPDHKIVQQDGRIRLWGKIEEAQNRILRVVLLEDAETVHNAFFDRRFKGVSR